jgi:IgGFc binding protein
MTRHSIQRNSVALIVKSVVWLGALVVAPFACDTSRDGFVESPSFGDAGADAPAPLPECVGKVRCSRDLRSVVDACDESRVVTECSAGEGCSGTTCVPACDAAAANGSSLGCEFATLVPSRFTEGGGSCFAAFLANSWSTPIGIDAEYAGAAIDLAASVRIVRTVGDKVTYEPFNGEVAPGDVAVVFLAQSPTATGEKWIACPEGVTPAVLKDTGIVGTARGSSFRIKTTAPVSAYSIWPFGGAASHMSTATLLLPVSSWKNDYVVTTAWERVVQFDAKPTVQIVAAEDDTEVTLIGSVPVKAGRDVESAEKGVPHRYKLSRGEVLQFAQRDDLIGSRVVADKSIAVFGGHECLRVPQHIIACDSGQLQLLPVRSWGREHAVVPHLTRLVSGFPEKVFFRVVAAVDGTVLTYDPVKPDEASPTLAAGGSTLFMTDKPFVVTSQDAEHPIAVYAYMTGSQFDEMRLSDGDPEFTYVVPVEQFLDRYTLYVEPIYRNSHLVVVRARPEGKDFEPVVLDCGGTLEGWQPVGSQGKYEYVHVPLTSFSLNQKVGDGMCGPGRRELNSRGPFGVAVWGTDYAVSYAYPGGSAIRTLNSLEPPLPR